MPKYLNFIWHRSTSDVFLSFLAKKLVIKQRRRNKNVKNFLIGTIYLINTNLIKINNKKTIQLFFFKSNSQNTRKKLK